MRTSTNQWSENPVYVFAAAFMLFSLICILRLPSKDKQLLVAARQGNTKTISSLILKGAHVNYSNEANGLTPLMVAVSYGNQANVELLLKAGADKNAKDKTGRTALDHALENHRTNLLSLLECNVP